MILLGLVRSSAGHPSASGLRGRQDEALHSEPPRESWRLWGVLTLVESDSWTHAAVVGWCRASNSSGVSILSDE
jgi:hypothetical protein